jgi:release factor glutamine methyltransferase
LVPRPETEELVEMLIADGGLGSADCKILDVGTGTGVIALSLANKLPTAKVVGVDISEDALQLAGENAKRLGLDSRVEFVRGNLLDAFSERFSLIVANLPYIGMEDRPSLSREVRHDPEIALFGGDHGDELIRQLIAQAPERLEPNGLLALELGAGQSEEVMACLREKKYKDIQAKTDYSGSPRFAFARYG